MCKHMRVHIGLWALTLHACCVFVCVCACVYVCELGSPACCYGNEIMHGVPFEIAIKHKFVAISKGRLISLIMHRW